MTREQPDPDELGPLPDDEHEYGAVYYVEELAYASMAGAEQMYPHGWTLGPYVFDASVDDPMRRPRWAWYGRRKAGVT